ncbi:thioesterase [Mycobacteroides saopaulense]|uniref:Thioesterase n=1 Tax=Mycobacteroides saopaulense TaxID=1578165 RepID=A0A1S4VL91_9MYCO|nr:PaaI family thioesterase [Mycobacteroides saopaulense]ALR13571.1 thioesterase [Mycobacteroides saopaulense]ORB54430.1 thioesterase [Mycobacteroides saopaulense]
MITLEQAQQVLDAQPFSRLLGASITRVDPSGIQIALDIRDELRQQSGLVHGGVLSYLADNAITYACGLGLGADIVTSGYTIEYVAPARDGSRLLADACLVSAGRTKALGRCEISIEDHGGNTKLVAVAQGTSMVRRHGA